MNQSFPFQELIERCDPPPVFSGGTVEFWTDPYIAKQMLQTHLSQETDAASRTLATIDRSVEWICRKLDLQPGNFLLDLGCGPGLYAARFAERGLYVTGVDFSQNSIDYAKKFADENRLNITYRCQNYLELDEPGQFDAVLLIYGDYCPMPSQQRKLLLAKIQKVLKPGGAFVFDVSTPRVHSYGSGQSRWHAEACGFWRPTPHLVLEQNILYPENVALDRYLVIEENGKITDYRNWFQDFTPETITQELQANGFLVESLWGDLTGSPYSVESDWIGVIAQRG